MDKKIEHLDLGFVNYTNHPTNNDYVVFRFADVHRANSFRELLKEQKIWFEESQDQKRQLLVYLFGLHHTDYNKAQKINITVEAKHKKFLISGKFFRWFIVLFGLTMIILAAIGYSINGSKQGTPVKTTR